MCKRVRVCLCVLDLGFKKENDCVFSTWDSRTFVCERVRERKREKERERERKRDRVRVHFFCERRRRRVGVRMTSTLRVSAEVRVTVPSTLRVIVGG